MANCLRAFYKKLVNKKIILNTYAQMLRKYYGKNKNKLLKYRFIDTSFIYSRNGGTLLNLTNILQIVVNYRLK